MRKHTLSHEEQVIQQHALPIETDHLDIASKVMHRLNENKRSKFFFAIRKPVSVVLSAVTILFVGSIVAYAAGIWSIKNEKGDTLYTAESLQPNSYAVTRFGVTAQPSKQEQAYLDAVNEVARHVPPGQGAAIYIPDESLNPQGTVFYVSQQIPFSTWDAFQQEVTHRNAPAFEYPAELPAGYSFKEGFVSSEVATYGNEEAIEAELKAGTKKSGEKAIVKEVPLEKNPKGVSITYANGEDTFHYSAALTGRKRTFVSQEAEVELVQAGSVDALFIRDYHGMRVEWVKGEESDPMRTLYKLSVSSNSKLTKEELLAIAKGVKK